MVQTIDTLFVPIMVILIILALFIIIEINERLGEVFNTSGVIYEYSAISKGIIYVIYGVYFGLPLAALILAFFVKSNIGLLIIAVPLLAVDVLLYGIMQGVMVEILPNFTKAMGYLAENELLINFIQFYPIIMFLLSVVLIIVQVLL